VILTAVPGLAVPGLLEPGRPQMALTSVPVQVLTPVRGSVTGLDITALLAAPAELTLQWQSPAGREILLVAASGSGITVTVETSSLVLGQAVGDFAPVTLTSGKLYAFGPYHSVLAGSASVMQVTLSATAGVTAALLASP
jgi:hypothetical protein